MEDFQTQGSVLKGSRNARLLVTESLQHNLFQQTPKDVASSEHPWERHFPSHARGGTRADGSGVWPAVRYLTTAVFGEVPTLLNAT